MKGVGCGAAMQQQQSLTAESAGCQSACLALLGPFQAEEG